MKFWREVKLISNFLASTNQNLKGYALLNPGKPDDSIDLLQCSPATLWHLRFRHAFTTRLQNHKLIKSNDNSTACPICIRAKHPRSYYKPLKTKTTKPIERVHSDICGPLTLLPESICNSVYNFLFTDDFTHYCWAVPTKNKLSESLF
jgi:hypothetical protein